MRTEGSDVIMLRVVLELVNALAKFCRKRPLYTCRHLEKFPCHNATFTIIETFAKLRELSRTINILPDASEE